MAKKRAAPSPPAESSEDIGSGSSTEEESSEEEIAQMPPAAATRNKAAPLPQKQTEASDEEEEEEEEDEDEEGEEGEEEAEEEEQKEVEAEEEVEEESDEEGEEEEEADGEEEDDGGDGEEEEEEVAEEKDGKQAEKMEEEGGKVEGSKLPPSSNRRKRAWSKDDEVRILEAHAAHRREQGAPPKPEDLEAALAGKLDHSSYSLKELMAKLASIKACYSRAAKRGDPPSTGTDRCIFDLANEVWSTSSKPANATVLPPPPPPSGFVPSDFGEMCAMYPFLGEVLEKLEKTRPGLFKRKLPKLTNDKASEWNEKFKKRQLLDVDVDVKGQQVSNEVTMELRGLV